LRLRLYASCPEPRTAEGLNRSVQILDIRRGTSRNASNVQRDGGIHNARRLNGDAVIEVRTAWACWQGCLDRPSAPPPGVAAGTGGVRGMRESWVARRRTAPLCAGGGGAPSERALCAGKGTQRRCRVGPVGPGWTEQRQVRLTCGGRGGGGQRLGRHAGACERHRRCHISRGRPRDGLPRVVMGRSGAGGAVGWASDPVSLVDGHATVT